MNIDKLETKYLTENQKEILSHEEKETLIIKKMSEESENECANGD